MSAPTQGNPERQFWNSLALLGLALCTVEVFLYALEHVVVVVRPRRQFFGLGHVLAEGWLFFGISVLVMAICIGIFISLATRRKMMPTDRSNYTGRCMNCKYDLAGLPRANGEGRCPECGTEFTEQAKRYRRVYVVDPLRGIITIGLLALCALGQSFVDYAWAAVYHLEGRTAKWIHMLAWRHTDQVGVTTLRAWLCLQLFMLVLLIASAHAVRNIARPLTSIMIAQCVWILIFTALSFHNSADHWWWPTGTWSAAAAWLAFPFYSALALRLAMRWSANERAHHATNIAHSPTHTD